MRTIRAKLEMTLFESVWDTETVERFHDVLGSLYDIEDFEVDEENPSKAYTTVVTNFDDDESGGSTVAYCMGEDLAESDLLGLDVLSVEAIEEEIL